MQLGMIGLGRMGANMVRRLMKDGHQCVVFDMFPKAVEALAAEKATGASSLAGLRRQAREAARVWLMVPAAVVDSTIHALAPLLEPGDTIIDGGNSYYIDDIRRASELAPKKIDYVDVGTSGGVWGLERGYCMMIGGPDATVQRLDPDLQDTRAGTRRHRAHAGARKSRRHRRARLPALRPERRRALREDGAQRHRVRHHGRVRRGPGHPARRRTSASRRMRSTRRRRRCAIPSTISTTSICPTSPKSGGAAA